MAKKLPAFINQTWHIDWCGLRLFCCQFDSQAWQKTDDKLFEPLAYRDLQSAASKRKAEFIAGRLMAHRALMHLGIETSEIGIGEHRSPIWPDGTLGSISHSQTMAVSGASYREHRVYVGMDIESLIPPLQAKQIGPLICTEEEWGVWRTTTLSLATFVTLIFSAKESVFKGVYPYVKRYLEFKDARLLSLDGQTLKFHLMTPELNICCDVAYQWRDDSVITLMSDSV